MNIRTLLAAAVLAAGPVAKANYYYLDNSDAYSVAAGQTWYDSFDANDSSSITVAAGTALVLYWDNGGGNWGQHAILRDSSTLTVGGAVYGYINATDSSTVTINGSALDGAGLETWIDVSDSATLTGSGNVQDVFLYDGTVGGSLNISYMHVMDGFARGGLHVTTMEVTGGTVAPGNSIGTLYFGTYSQNAGVLSMEIGGTAGGAGVDPNGFDQIRVTNDLDLSGTAQLAFPEYNGFHAARRDVFQIIADGAGAARATQGTFDTVVWGDTGNTRILFDHSTGKAYGTGLTFGTNGYTNQTFRDYGNTANRREIGRALWMESIQRDNTTAFTDENFDDTALNSGETGQGGQRAFILTRDNTLLDNTQVATDLGQQAVTVLTAVDAALALERLSPEAYAGLGDLNVRFARTVALRPTRASRLGAEAGKWSFDFAYVGEQLTAKSSSAYTSYKSSGDAGLLTGDLGLGSGARLNLAVGINDGKVSALGFDSDSTTGVVGLGLTLSPESRAWRLDIGTSLATTDWKSVRGGASASGDNDHSYSVAVRLTGLAKPATAPGETASKLTASPYVGVAFASSSIGGFTESDVAGQADLTVADFRRNSLVGEVGLQADYAFSATFALTGVLAYEHDFTEGGQTDISAQFTDDGVEDTTFAIRSHGFGQNIARIGLGFRKDFGDHTTLGASYSALVSPDARSAQQVQANLSFRF